MSIQPPIAVFGAYGHTGRFVTAELQRRGHAQILCGRDAEKLHALAREIDGAEVRVAAVDAAASLDAALAGAGAVINCAGPFADTAVAVLNAALRGKIAYLDVAAEVEVAAAAFGQHAQRVRDAGLIAIPAMAFYGGLGDLLATAAMGDWADADEIAIAYALSSWKPTRGTRATIQTSKRRRQGRRLVLVDGALSHSDAAAPVGEWEFPDPIGTRRVVGEFLTADSIAIGTHLRCAKIDTCMTQAALQDLADPDESPPPPIDACGRSAQTFMVDVSVRRGDMRRRAVATGQDIYAITAPLVVEALQRILAGKVDKRGVLAAGDAFAARDFLLALGPDVLRVALDGA